jgi:hypothetical protein
MMEVQAFHCDCKMFSVLSDVMSAVLSPLHMPVPFLLIPGWGVYSGTSPKSASWRQCAQLTYEFFGPKYQTHHSSEEVAA